MYNNFCIVLLLFLADWTASWRSSVMAAPSFLVSVPSKMYEHDEIKFGVALTPGGQATPSRHSPTTLHVQIDHGHIVRSFALTSYEPVLLAMFGSPHSLGIVGQSSFTLRMRFTSSDLAELGTFASTVQLITDDVFLFAQTEKPIYTPGEAVHIFIAGINHLLMPLSKSHDSVTLRISDPHGTPVVATTFALPHGLTHFPIGTNHGLVLPAVNHYGELGRWTIQVFPTLHPALTTRTSFWVRNLLTPNFRTSFNFGANGNPYWVFDHKNENNYKMAIIVRSLSGAPVSGRVVVALSSTGGCNPHGYGRPLPRHKILSRLTAGVVLHNFNNHSRGVLNLKGLNTVLLSGSPKSTMRHRSCTLRFVSTFTEDVTGITADGEGEVVIYRYPFELRPDETTENLLHLRGSHVVVNLKVTKPDGTPAGAGISVEVIVNLWRPSRPAPPDLHCSKSYAEFADFRKQLRTNQFGIVSFKLNIPNNLQSYHILAYLTAHHHIGYCTIREVTRQTIQSSRRSVWLNINPPVSNKNPSVGSVLEFQIGTSFPTSTVYLMVKGLDSIFHYSVLNVDVADLSIRTAKVTLTVDAPPQASAVAWAVNEANNEIVAAGVTFKVDGMLRNNLSAYFEEANMAVPGEQDKKLLIHGSSQSTFAVQCVDEAVLETALNGNFLITPSRIFERIASKSLPAGSWDSWFSRWTYRSVSNLNAKAVFAYLNLNVVTDGHTGSFSLPSAPISISKRTQRISVMRNLPATIFANDRMSTVKGLYRERFNVPNTVARYEISALAVSPKHGLGFLLPPAFLPVRHSVRVMLKLAIAAVVLGEEVQLTVVLVNNREVEESVSLKLHRSEHFLFSSANSKGWSRFGFSDISVIRRLEPKQTLSITIWIRAAAIGRDIELAAVYRVTSLGQTYNVKKLISVFAPGEPVYINSAYFVNLAVARPVEQYVSFTSNSRPLIVPGSRSFKVSVMGDLLGPFMADYAFSRHLVRIPTRGGGEQTMMSLSVNVYVAQLFVGPVFPVAQPSASHLDGLRQLVSRSVLRMVNHYRRHDLGFSLFGHHDSASSVFLTAFVVRIFAKILFLSTTKPVIFPFGTVDPNDIAQAWHFIIGNARPDGTFHEYGTTVISQMKDGARGDVNLAAYVYLTYAESVIKDTLALRQWTSFTATQALLKTSALLPGNSDAFQIAVIFYALTIDPTYLTTNEYTAIYLKLQNLATTTDDVMFWLVAGAKKPSDSHSHPVMIEIAGYVLLAVINRFPSDPTRIKIANYLIGQRNALGGFVSTQDTSVGLQALAAFHRTLLNPPSQLVDVTVTLYYNHGTTQTREFATIRHGREMFSLQRHRAGSNLVLAKFNLTTATPPGFAYFQLYETFNVPRVKSGHFTTFHIKELDIGADGALITLHACAAPKHEFSSMVLIEIGLPTGFDADFEATITANMHQQRGNGAVTVFKDPLRKIERGERKLVYYLHELTSHHCVVAKLKALSSISARLIKPAQARVYSFYEPNKMSSLPFTFQAMNSSVDYALSFEESAEHSSAVDSSFDFSDELN